MNHDTIKFESAQQQWISKLNISQSELDSITQQIPHPKYADFVLNSFDFEATDEGEQFQIASYNNIKDPSWPVCHSYQDLKNLPDHIIDECKNVHGFDFLIYNEKDITPERWQSYNNGRWPVWELVRYKHVILEIQQYFKDKTIVDFAAHAGIISLMALHVGAKFATVTNVREEYVRLAAKMLSLSTVAEKFTASYADIHDYKNNTKLCQGVDTVLLYGIMYHVHDHCEILDSVVQAQPEHIVIDTFVPNSIINQPTALMQWTVEPTEVVWNGWLNNQKFVTVGQPNYAWFKLYLEQKNYRSVHYKNYYCNGVNSLAAPENQRSIMVFERT